MFKKSNLPLQTFYFRGACFIVENEYLISELKIGLISEGVIFHFLIVFKKLETLK